jgi:hypothetical protein
MINSAYYLANSPNWYRSLSLQNATPSEFDMYVMNALYHLQLDKMNNFSIGGKSSYVQTQNTSNFGSVANNIYTPYPTFTGQFNYHERVNALNGDYNHIFSKKWSLELGLRAEQTISDAITPNANQDLHNNYIDFFPNVQLSNVISDDDHLLFSYGRKITRPRYEDLNPFLVYSDQFTYQLGNPYLKPYYSNSLDVNFIHKSISATLGFSVINNFQQIVYTQAPQSQVSILQRVNLGNRYNYDLHLIAPVVFTNWYSTEFDVDLRYQDFTSPQAGYNNGSQDITIQATQQIKLPLGLKAEVFASYETPTVFGVFSYRSNYDVDAGLSRGMFNKRANITLKVDDIFNSDKEVYSSNYLGQNINGELVSRFRTISLNFSYALGSQAIKAARARRIGADEEQSRATGSN